MSRTKVLLLIVIAAALAAVYYFDATRFLSLEYFKSQQAAVDEFVATRHLLSVVIFFGVYVAVTALSIPGAALMTLIAGALFGLLEGLIIVSFASTLGATLAMLVSRLLLRDVVQKRFASQLKTINTGVAKEGALYLFTLRLVPVVPFFVINLAMGLTRMPARTFFWVSQVGMLAGTAVYVNAGTQIANIDSLQGIVSAPIILSFVLLGLFPWFARHLVALVKRRQVYKNHPKPTQFDEDIVVLGAGSGGLVTAYIAAMVKARVTLIERHQMGGDCLNTGCVPSKALIRSSKFMADASRASDLGFRKADVEFSFGDIMARVQRVIKDIEPHDSIERYTNLGVNVVQGEARITSPWTVEVNGQTITTRNIVVATGARPFVPPIKGVEDIDILTSDNLWQLQEQPERLLVLGGGPIGCELSQSFARLGSKVTQVEMLPRLMIREDEDVSTAVQQRFAAEGVDVRVDHKAVEFVKRDGRQILICEHGDEKVEIEFDRVLVAVGRAANSQGFGLQELGVETNPNGTIAVNEYLQTRYPNIYAVGDVIGPYQFTHTSAHQAWYAAVNALFGRFKSFKVDYSVIPWATFTEPEVARVGLNELDAKEQGIDYEVTCFDVAELDRAIADEEAHGFVKVLTVPGKDKILGVTIVGEQAGDLIAEYVMAMKHNIGLNKILGTIHIYPTLAEMNKYAAGEWKRARKPEALLAWVERFFSWQRGDKPAPATAPRSYGSLADRGADAS
ncbi:dihydrolipoyl dehydrogenase [Pseudomaricurvus alkylphenolicus]|uniref:dihydrolipoyl dehydrogenase n=1 Tax=Pseudomaricurvus alkylphenolicus TaxID=1306991 RepID=UPI0014206802|nr:dihydrolipoyl dehydrogenase [Pseudomaricurvus alkylphenolicus]NIB41635.1 dihydrolipoyl dehydrogenase [Pseudomaricurvus alkylphenolicus]